MKASATPKGYKAQSARDAVHWLTYSIARIGDLVASKPSATVACGYALPPERVREGVTEASMAVTCWLCAKRAQQAGHAIHKPGEER